jgi:hypothetical protein
VCRIVVVYVGSNFIKQFFENFGAKNLAQKIGAKKRFQTCCENFGGSSFLFSV